MTNAETCELTILWLKANPHAKQGMRHFLSVVMPVIKRVLDGGSSCKQLTSYLTETLHGDVQAGCLGAQPPTTALQWSPTSDDPVVQAYSICKRFNLVEENEGRGQRAEHLPPPPPLVLSGHAASLTPY